jgi:hypothetical protein
VTYGAQTYPADGNAGMIVTTRARAAELSQDAQITVQIIEACAEPRQKGFMPMANAPAAKRA